MKPSLYEEPSPYKQFLVRCIRLAPVLHCAADEVPDKEIDWVRAAEAVYLADIARANARE